MSRYSNSDHYIDAKTGVLKNRLGIRSDAELEKAEADLAGTRSYELSHSPLKGNFDFEHLRALHHYLFKDLYEWAGEPRNIDISKGSNFFAHHSHIKAAAKVVFDELKKEKYLAGLTKARFSARAAYYLGEINALHPFREGNGRVQREFISHLAYKNGYQIDWQHIDQETMVAASIASFKGDHSKFLSYIKANIKKLPKKKSVPAHKTKKSVKRPNRARKVLPNVKNGP